MLKDYKRLNKEIAEWVRFSKKDKDAWHLRNMHIDQFSIFKKVKRVDWIKRSFELFDYIDGEIFNYYPLRLCLHIELIFTETEENIKSIDLDYLNLNIHELTPPSFMFIEQQYLDENYLNRFDSISVAKEVQALNEVVSELKFYYQTVYDKEEELYLREIYVIK